MRKKPNPGLVAPRAGGRAKWPSHFGRDQGSCLLDVQPPEKVAGYQRFTRPSRDVLIISKRDPRRSTTVVLDAPHPMPVGPNTPSGWDPSKRTPASSGPTQRTSGVQVRPSQRSILSESTATTSRARVPRMIATWRVTARPVVTLAASASTASQSSTPPSRGQRDGGHDPRPRPGDDELEEGETAPHSPQLASPGASRRHRT